MNSEKELGNVAKFIGRKKLSKTENFNLNMNLVHNASCKYMEIEQPTLTYPIEKKRKLQKPSSENSHYHL